MMQGNILAQCSPRLTIERCQVGDFWVIDATHVDGNFVHAQAIANIQRMFAGERPSVEQSSVSTTEIGNVELAVLPMEVEVFSGDARVDNNDIVPASSAETILPPTLEGYQPSRWCARLV